MGWQATPYTVVQGVVAGALALSAGFALWRHRLPFAEWAALLTTACAWWLVASAATLAATDLPAKLFGLRMQYLSIAAIPALWLAYALRYTGRERWLLRRPLLAVLVAMEAVGLTALVWTNEWHGLVWQQARLVVQHGLLGLEMDHGPAFWFHILYVGGIIVVSARLFTQAAVRSPGLYRRQSRALLAVVILPLLAVGLLLANANPLAPLDLLPLVVGISGLLLGWTLRLWRQSDLVPAARAAAVESMADAVVVLDSRDRVMDLNPAASTLLGHAVGQPIDLVWPGWPGSDAAQGSEVTLQAGDGDPAPPGTGEPPRVFDLSISPLLDWRRRLVGRVAVARDVTRRRLTERALQDSEARYRAVLEQSDDNIYLMDAHTGRVLEANAALHNFLGYEPGALHGEPITMFVEHPAEDIAAKLRQVLAEGRLFMQERRYRRHDGSTVPVEVRGTVITYRGQEALCVVSRDITQRQQAAEALTRHNADLEQLYLATRSLNATLSVDEVLRAVAEQMQVMLDVKACSVWVMTPDAGELVCSHSTCPCPEQMIGRRVRIGDGLLGWVARTGASLLVPDTLADPQTRLEWAEQAGVTPRSALAVPLVSRRGTVGVIQAHHCDPNRFTPKDVPLAEALAAAAAIALENARLYEDLQGRMEELRRAQTQLVESNRLAAVGELAAGVAHELNNPLQPILGFAELLLEKGNMEGWQRRYLTIITREARRARDIVRSLLDFAGYGPPDRELADVNEVVRAVLGLVAEQLRSKDIVVKTSYDSDLPCVSLKAGRIKQVMLNLLTNAAQAMPDGGTLVVTTTSPSGGGVAVHIADSGLGIAPEHRDRIFEPFFTTRPVGQGSGLGLSVSLGIVQEHGGRIEVQSEGVPGRGSIFTVWLPANSARHPADSAGKE